MIEQLKGLNLTDSQIQRKVSAKIKAYIKKHPNKHLQYYYCRGLFHINNIDTLTTAKGLCETATGVKFTHFSNSICKLDYSQF